MAKPIVTDELWNRLAPLFPAPPPRPKGGRPPVPDRVALTGILFVLRSGLQWELLPKEMGCSGMTCWRRLRDWQIAGLWQRLWQSLLDELGQADAIEWQRAMVDSSSVRAIFGGRLRGRTRPIGPKTAANATC
jgi:transposase